MRETILEKNLRRENKNRGDILGQTTGWYSYRKGSNMRRLLDKLVESGRLDSIDQALIIQGAKLQRASQGRQIAIVRKEIE